MEEGNFHKSEAKVLSLISEKQETSYAQKITSCKKFAD